MASYEQVLEYVTTPSTTEPTTLISAFSDSRIVSTFIVSNVGSSSANVSMAIYDGSDNKLVSILSDYSIGIGKSQTLNVNSLNLPATYKVMVESDSEDVNFCASGVKVTATYTGDAEDVIEEYTEAAKAVIDQAVIDAEAQIDAYAEGYEDTITNFASTTLQPYADDAAASATAAAASESNAATSEANASASASSAATSESNASASASSAATSESNAATSATNAATSEANTQALFDNFDSSVAESVGLAAIPYPDLHIPFNDGLRIESGYGTNDQIDVSAAQDGSVMVDLPSMSVDFTRSSTSTVIDKSGILTSLTADEAGIGSDGVCLHESYTNLITYSDFDGGYPMGGSTVWGSNVEYKGFTFGTFTSSSVSLKDYSITAGSDFGFSCVIYSNGSTSSQRVRVESRGDAVRAISIVIDFSGLGVTEESLNTGWNYEVESLGSDLYRVNCHYDAQLESLSNNSVRVTAYPLVDGGESLYAAYQLVEGATSKLPFLPTNSTTTSSTATTCTVQVENNLPATGYSWSLEQNLAIERDSSEDRFTFYLDSGDFYGFYVDTTGYLYLSDSTGNTQIGQIDDSGQHKTFICYDADNLTITAYDNTEEIGSITLTEQLTMPSSGNIHLGGADGDSYLNGQMGENKIWHNVALTADQVKSRG